MGFEAQGAQQGENGAEEKEDEEEVIQLNTHMKRIDAMKDSWNNLSADSQAK